MKLIINSFGTSLNRDNEGFVITTSEGRQRVPAEGITSIQISKGKNGPGRGAGLLR